MTLNKRTLTNSLLTAGLGVFAFVGGSTAAIAQDGAPAKGPVATLESPAMPRIYWGQTSRFTNDFNPAIGLALDASIRHSDEEDGYSVGLDLAEITTQGPLAPNWWGNLVIETNSDEVALTESAIYYTGLGERSALRGGKFFVDFGKQMQQHVHDLAMPNRPAVLREYLGYELAGEGIQFDHWSPLSDETAFRFSVGLFGEMGAHDHSGEGHGDHGDHDDHGGEEHGEVEMHIEDYRDLADLTLTARATAMTNVGSTGVLQVGASLKTIPDFAYEGAGEDDTGAEIEFEAEGLDQSITGFDITYGWANEDGSKGWNIGAEFIRAEGALGAEIEDDELATVNLAVVDGSAQGYFAFVEHDLDGDNEIGVMVSTFEHIEESDVEETETSIYWNHWANEYARIRLAAVHRENDEGEDSQAIVVQLTGYVGAHGHPYNW